LAHHDGVGVYYSNQADRLKAEFFRRSYPPGSVALLASCATSNPRDDMAILRTLNQNGIEAMIVSPFRIPVDYGARLVMDFTNSVRLSRKNRETPTVAQLFAKAAADTARYFIDKGDRRLQYVALEFILVGNPSLKLCAP
jgi:DNA-binding LacI/PurR family transcriptional regulator